MPQDPIQYRLNTGEHEVDYLERAEYFQRIDARAQLFAGRNDLLSDYAKACCEIFLDLKIRIQEIHLHREALREPLLAEPFAAKRRGHADELDIDVNRLAKRINANVAQVWRQFAVASKLYTRLAMDEYADYADLRVHNPPMFENYDAIVRHAHFLADQDFRFARWLVNVTQNMIDAAPTWYHLAKTLRDNPTELPEALSVVFCHNEFIDDAIQSERFPLHPRTPRENNSSEANPPSPIP